MVVDRSSHQHIGGGPGTDATALRLTSPDRCTSTLAPYPVLVWEPPLPACAIPPVDTATAAAATAVTIILERSRMLFGPPVAYQWRIACLTKFPDSAPFNDAANAPSRFQARGLQEPRSGSTALVAPDVGDGHAPL